jgi:hypothetical protein
LELWNQTSGPGDPFPANTLYLNQYIDAISDFDAVVQITLSTTVPKVEDGTPIDITDMAQQAMKAGDTIMLLYTDWGNPNTNVFQMAEYKLNSNALVDTTNKKINILVDIDSRIGDDIPPDGSVIEFRWMPLVLQAHTHHHDTLLGLDPDGNHIIDDVSGLQDALDWKASIGHIHPPPPASDDLAKTVYQDIYTNYIAPIEGSSGISFVGGSEAPQHNTDSRQITIPIPYGVVHEDFMIVFLMVQGYDQPIAFAAAEISYDTTGRDPVSTTQFTQIVTPTADVEFGFLDANEMQQQILANVANQTGATSIPPYADLLLDLPAAIPTGLPLRAVLLAYRGVDPADPFHSIHNAGNSSSLSIPSTPADQNNLMTIVGIGTCSGDQTGVRPRYFYTLPWTPLRRMSIATSVTDISYYFGEFYTAATSAKPYPTIYMSQYPYLDVDKIQANGIVILRSKLSSATTSDAIVIGGDIDMDGNKIFGLQDPQPNDPSSAVSKKYVDSTIWKSVAVRARSKTNINLAAPPAVIDGITLYADNRVLLTNQTDAKQNGIWLASSPWRRADDFQHDWQMRIGAIVYVEDGYTYGGQWFVLTHINGQRRNLAWSTGFPPLFTWGEGIGTFEVLWGAEEPNTTMISPNGHNTLIWVPSDPGLSETTLRVEPDRVAANQPVTFTITVTATGGNVQLEYLTGTTWTSEGLPFPVNTSGIATLTIPVPESRTYRVQYLGQPPVYLPSTSNTVTVLVGLTTTTVLSPIPDTINAGDSIVLAADATAPYGNIQFEYSMSPGVWTSPSGPIGVDGSGKASYITKPPATSVYRAVYLASGLYRTSTSNVENITVKQMKLGKASSVTRTGARFFGCNVQEAEAVASTFAVGPGLDIPYDYIKVISVKMHVSGHRGELCCVKGAIWYYDGLMLMADPGTKRWPDVHLETAGVPDAALNTFNFPPFNLSAGTYLIGFWREHTNCACTTLFDVSSQGPGNLYYDHDMVALGTFTKMATNPLGNRSLVWEIEYMYWQ